MDFRSLVKPTVLMVFTVLTFISCNYFFENNKSKIAKTEERMDRIRTSKKEAKLLVDATKNNLDILQLCEDIQTIETEKEIKDLAKNLEKTHIEIDKNYNKLAREKLISIPNYANRINKINLDDEINIVKSNLKLILNKIESQLELLDTLSQVSNKPEFKVIVVQDSFKLNSSKSKILETLSSLNETAKTQI